MEEKMVDKEHRLGEYERKAEEKGIKEIEKRLNEQAELNKKHSEIKFKLERVGLEIKNLKKILYNESKETGTGRTGVWPTLEEARKSDKEYREATKYLL